MTPTPPPGPVSPFAPFIKHPGQGLPPAIAARVVVTPATVQHAAGNFGTGQADLADAWMRLQGVLESSGGMAGNDKAANAFNTRYRPAVAVACKAFDKVITTLGGTSLGLTATANNYVRADHHSRADHPAVPPNLFSPAQVYPAMSTAPPPSVIGAADGGMLFGWEAFYTKLLAGYWPAAHPDKLRSAAKAWHTTATEVDKVAGWLDWTINGLTDVNEGAAFTAISGFWAKVHKPADAHTVLGGLSLICTALGNSCDQFATLTDKVRNQMINRVGQVEAETVIGVGTAAIVGRALGAILGTITDAALAAVTITVGRILTDDVITTLEAAVHATPTITAIEADFETAPELALNSEMAATEGKTLEELGSIDQSASTFQPGELKIAELLQSEGKTVKAVPESTVDGQKMYDALVDGVPTEFKSLEPGSNNAALKGALNKAKKQASDAIVDCRGSGLTESEAQRGLARFLGANPGRMNSIRIVGEGFEIDWP